MSRRRLNYIIFKKHWWAPHWCVLCGAALWTMRAVVQHDELERAELRKYFRLYNGNAAPMPREWI